MAAIASHLHGPVPLAINELPVICTLSKVPVLVKKFPPDSNWTITSNCPCTAAFSICWTENVIDAGIDTPAFGQKFSPSPCPLTCIVVVLGIAIGADIVPLSVVLNHWLTVKVYSAVFLSILYIIRRSGIDSMTHQWNHREIDIILVLRLLPLLPLSACFTTPQHGKVHFRLLILTILIG